MKSFVPLFVGIGAIATVMGAVALGKTNKSCPAPCGVSSAQNAAQPQSAGGFDLVSGLRTAVGCESVAASINGRGDDVIVARFAGRDSLLAWFRGDLQKQATNTTLSTASIQGLVDAVPETAGPVLAVVTVKGLRMPRFMVTQPRTIDVTVDLFQPIPALASAADARTKTTG